MRVLLVDDHPYYIDSVRRDLVARYGHKVDCVNDPTLAEHALGQEQYDVVIADILYDMLLRDFEARRAARAVRLTGEHLLLSGLYVLQSAIAQHPGTGLVVLTGGDPLRSLHLLYAYEELGVRVFVSKTTQPSGADLINSALMAAAEKRVRVDPVLNLYLPAEGTLPLRRTLLRSEARRMIWRAVALNHHSRKEISVVTGLAQKTIGNLIPEMVDQDLQVHNPGLRVGRSKFNELVNYAATHWAFFLDEAVRREYP